MMKTLPLRHGRRAPRSPETSKSPWAGRRLTRGLLLLVAVPALLLAFGCHPPGAQGLLNESQHDPMSRVVHK